MWLSSQTPARLCNTFVQQCGLTEPQTSLKIERPVWGGQCLRGKR